MPDPIKDILTDTGQGQQINVDPSQSFSALQQTFSQPETTAPVPNIEQILPQNTPSFESRLSQSDIARVSDDILAGEMADRELQRQMKMLYPDNPALEGLSSADYMPGITDPILKGNVGGRVIGSQPIFVRSGAYIPYNVMDERKRALERVAKARAAAASSFQPPKIPLTKDPRFQQRVNDQFDSIYNSMVKEAQEKYGDNAFLMLQNPNSSVGRKWAQAIDNLSVYAREVDQVTDLVSDIRKGQLSGEQVYSQETNGLVEDFFRLTGEFEGGKVDVNIRKTLNDLQGSLSVDKAFKDYGILDKLNYSINQVVGNITESGDWASVRDKTTKTIKDQAKVLAKQLKDPRGGILSNSPYSEEEIAQRIEAIYGDQILRDMEFKARPTGGAGSGYRVSDKSLLNRQDNITVWGLSNVPGESIQLSNTVPIPKGKDAKPVQLTGGSYFTEDGQLVQLEAGKVVSFDPAAFTDVTLPTGEVVAGTTGYIIRTNDLGKEEKVPVLFNMTGKQAEFRSGTGGKEGAFDFFSEGSKANKEINYTEDFNPYTEYASTQQRQTGITGTKTVDKKNPVSGNAPTSAQSKQKKTYPLPAGKPKTVQQGGYTYTWNDETGQYE